MSAPVLLGTDSVPSRSTESVELVGRACPTNKTNERTNARRGCERHKSPRFVTRAQAYEISSLVKNGALRAAITTAAKEAATTRETPSEGLTLEQEESTWQ